MASRYKQYQRTAPLSSCSDKIMFFCTQCFSKVPFSLKIDTDISHQYQEQQNFDKRLQAVESKINELTKGINTQLDKHQQLLSTTITQCLNPTAPQEMLTDEDNTIPSPIETPLENLAHSIVSEQKEKEKRQLNLVLHNVLEPLDQDASDRKSADLSRVTSLFSDYLGITCSVTNAVWIGKKGTKPRLLKVTVSDLQDKISILQNKMKLRDKNLPECIRSIFVNADLTPLEQKKNKKLR